jgi:hypothetical protein
MTLLTDPEPSLSVWMTPTPAVSDLHEKVHAQFGSESSMSVNFNYYLNDMSLKGSVHATMHMLRCYDDEGHMYWYYIYEAMLLWYPDYFGNYLSSK